ncbi:MAG: hypothetical protein ACI9U2_001943 [Bradymonadia bacterium]|jgi:hypothetical protein
MYRLLVLTAALFTLPACEFLDSGDLDTTGIWAEILVEHDGDGTVKVTTDLTSGGRLSNTWLDLTDGDRLDASLNSGDTQKLRGRDLLNRYWYTTTFDSAPVDALVNVAFSREEKEDAPVSQVRMPLNFNLTAPTANAAFGPDEAISIAWSNSSEDNFDIRVTGNCIETWSESIGDSGSFRLPADALTRRTMDPGCEVTIALERVRGGRVDAAFDGGEIVAKQRRDVTVQVTRAPAPTADE